MKRSSETDRQSDAMTVQRAFASTKKVWSHICLLISVNLVIELSWNYHCQDPAFSASRSHSSELLVASPTDGNDYPSPVFPQLQSVPRILPLRVASMLKILVSAHYY